MPKNLSLQRILFLLFVYIITVSCGHELGVIEVCVNKIKGRAMSSILVCDMNFLSHEPKSKND
jgi:hypothetical protein